jgi:hypothetical protein
LVENYCATCQRSKRATGKRYGHLQRIEPPTRTWESFKIDFITCISEVGEQSYNTVIAIVDRFSGLRFFLPCHDGKTAKSVAQLYVESVRPIVGLPEIIISN